MEVEAPITTGPPNKKKCPSCKAYALRRLYSPPLVVQHGDPKTFGQQAELNAKRAGKEKMEILGKMSDPKNRSRATELKLPPGVRRRTPTKPPPSKYFEGGQS